LTGGVRLANGVDAESLANGQQRDALHGALRDDAGRVDALPHLL
jgi:hypothetical protein